jgi:hypothetical protein
MRHIAEGQDAVAEELLRRNLWYMSFEPQFRTPKAIMGGLKAHTVMAELLERRGTEEALAEARTMRDGVLQQLAEHEAWRTAALEETRAEAAEAVRQWREKRAKAIQQKKGGKAKGKKKGGKGKKKKGRRGKGGAKGTGTASAAAVEDEPARESAGGEAEGASAVTGAAAAEAEQKAQGEELQPPEEEEEIEDEPREECAICLQDLVLEDEEESWCDEGGEAEALVVLRCGHHFHAICGDLWCAKCADTGWGVTCPACRAAYVVRRS